MKSTSAPVLGRLSPREQLTAGRLPRRLVQLVVGLVVYGFTMALMVRAKLGNDPWDVFHQGLSVRIGLSFGTVVILVGVLVLLLWIPLREMPGLGTVLNTILIGAAADVALHLISTPHAMSGRITFAAAGIVGNGVATAMYIGAQLGPGPRDGLMTSLHRRTGWPIGVVRTGLEITVVVVGLLLGGVFGVATLAYALLIGPLVQLMLPRFIVDLAPAALRQPRVRRDPDPYGSWLWSGRQFSEGWH
ncbi:membrane protein YczE [Nocardioides baekrokdamisoli]|nr:hypothetical protein [Nocardioides baekrokdamisoli]